jgi:7SK snRNA methylphosphate capping enzyme
MASRGNYLAYQGSSRHSGTNPSSHILDSRLRVLPHHIFTNARVLDVGCNNGAITGHLIASFPIRHVTAVDVDPALVSKARSHASFIQSRRRDGKGSEAHYYPVSSVIAHGHRRRDGGEEEEEASFRVEDWGSEEGEGQDGSLGEKYDVLLALSVVKWVHLTWLDEGLVRFFARVHDALEVGGYFVFAPQDWKSYGSAVRKNRALKGRLDELKVRPGEFGDMLTGLGFVLVCRFGGESGLSREVFVYRKG